MKVLITGGAGFIGSHLAESYLERGDEVYIIDDLSTGSMDNIEHLKGNHKFTYYIDTIRNQPLTAEVIDTCDIIYHLAAAVGVKLIVESPVNTIETNIQGTDVVLRLAAKKRKRVLVASTSEVYGKRETVPFREDDDLIMGPTSKGRWSYACSKAIDEFMAINRNFHRGIPDPFPFRHRVCKVIRRINVVTASLENRVAFLHARDEQRAVRGELRDF